jgi:hypothetical protein
VLLAPLLLLLVQVPLLLGPGLSQQHCCCHLPGCYSHRGFLLLIAFDKPCQLVACCVLLPLALRAALVSASSSR